MATVVIMPRQGQSVESCVITSWAKKVGDPVHTGETLFSYETDKAAFDEEAKVDGTLLAVFYQEQDDVPCLSEVAVIGAPGEDVSHSTGVGTRNHSCSCRCPCNPDCCSHGNNWDFPPGQNGCGTTPCRPGRRHPYRPAWPYSGAGCSIGRPQHLCCDSGWLYGRHVGNWDRWSRHAGRSANSCRCFRRSRNSPRSGISR